MDVNQNNNAPAGENKNEQPNQQTPPAQNNPAQNPTAPTQTPPSANSDLEAVKAENIRLAAEVEEFKKKQTEANKAQEDAEKKRKEDEETRLKEQGDFKKLYETTLEQLNVANTKIADLSGFENRFKSLAGQAESQLETEIAAFPDTVKALQPPKDQPIEARIAWAVSVRPLVAEFNRLSTPAAGGNKPNPAPANPKTNIQGTPAVQASKIF